MRESGTAARRRRWRLRDLRLRARLVLLVLVPLVAGVALASGRVVSENATIRSENDLNGQAHVALAMAGLIYAVEDERDLVEVYLTDGEQNSDFTALTKAEAATQARISDIYALVGSNYTSSLAALPDATQTLMLRAEARLGDLPTLRTSVTSLGTGRPIYQAYTTIISDLLNFSGQLATDTTDHALASYVSSLALVEQVGEQASQERGYLVGILGGGGQQLAQQEDLVQAQAQYNGTLATINAQAPASIVDLYQADVGGNATGAADSTVQQTIDAALQDFPVSQIGASDTTAYADTSTKINQIRAIEAVVGQDIMARTSALIASARDDLYLNLGIIVAVLLLAFLATAVIARSISRPLQVLRTSALDIADVRLPAVIERLRGPARGEQATEVRPIPIDSTNEVGSVARAFDEVHHAAVRLASEQAMLRASVNAVFTNLSRRSQTLVERQLALIDDLESGEREPGRLAQLFRLDHLATRMRRNNENLLVLAGEESARRWTEAVRLVDVARAAAAEVEHYERIILGEVPRVGIVGQAAPDIAHLVAELLENATAFSAPHTKVWIAARAAEDNGVVLRIEDAGIGMKPGELDEANERIANPPVVDVSVARRMGLYVVGRLAARYGISVRLAESQAGGVAALIHLPFHLLTQSLGETLNGRSQVDDEFYALSRQFARAANQGTNVVRDLSALPLPELEAEDTGWFQPSEDRKNEPAEAEPVPEPPRPAPRTQFPQRHARPEPPPRVEPPPEPAPPEPTPIFEAIESEWFRRREQARAAAEASRQAPLRPEPSPGPAAPAPMPQRQPSAPAAPYAAPFPAQQPAPAPPSPSQAPAAAQPAPASAAPADWSSPADEGWRAARALANPAQDGVTQAGLPRRTPRANLVPGRAGGTGAARAVPPHNLRRDSSPGGRP
ncbi:nitrate- and nitrite sensing domain-containing protein [Actinospica sp.]|uniref:sensor histidine kinase n=1 Tax=Actinospica sp. TaxID=1872142 RepID=UPI002BAD80C9|nr:nitrate- and nitrite sensing domain-containing protein [Actinospica sp.]HWG24772.1 nitrate- and nitrite sensing domain-containing protein [Actinospica sp.]